MKFKLILVALVGLMIASCGAPADGVTGTYLGDFTQASTTYYNINCAITKDNENTVSLAFSGVGITSFTISGVTAASNNGNYTLIKSATGETMAGTLVGTTLNCSITYSGGNASYVGVKQ